MVKLVVALGGVKKYVSQKYWYWCIINIKNCVIHSFSCNYSLVSLAQLWSEPTLCGAGLRERRKKEERRKSVVKVHNLKQGWFTQKVTCSSQPIIKVFPGDRQRFGMVPRASNWSRRAEFPFSFLLEIELRSGWGNKEGEYCINMMSSGWKVRLYSRSAWQLPGFYINQPIPVSWILA